MKQWLFLLVFICLGNLLYAQRDSLILVPSQGDTARIINVEKDTFLTAARELTDTVKTKGKPKFLRFLDEPYPSPKKAFIFSAVIPGAGQLYNKQWWKLPFVYGAYGGVVYSIQYNRDRYNRYNTAYLAELKGLPHEFSDVARADSQTLRTFRDRFDKNLQLSYIGVVAVHLLQGVDAFVAAHLKDFDTSDDLSMRILPTTINTPGLGSQVGIGVSWEF